MARHEEGCDVVTRDPPFIPLLAITRQRTRQADSDWYQPCEIELAFADRKQAVGEVHILQRET